MAPTTLTWVAPRRRASSQKREAENFPRIARPAPTPSAPIVE